ncbi:hypothetical protein PPERSA_03296 [Pseudocohnilembus persalinus]|uniref:Uncharacterized protein n=1 Tax=Pseudocohnilembus persalinus TaxID=266149 RepID=A0A0V0Q8G2_PSEPJ|nr:hypothetical protein PPERSA_03296 [Pseudocohnilembus persalinus]|eukprot:KRW98465.1 hypothetical protein PPERSA_03296 [Pseudocohnilembus persalinus]
MKKAHEKIQSNVDFLKNSLTKLLVAKKNGEKISNNEELTSEHNQIFQTLMRLRKLQSEEIKSKENEIVSHKEQIKALLNEELQQREKKAQFLKEREQYKKKMMEEHDKSIRQFTEDLPKKLVDICKEIKPVQQIFKIPYQQNPYQIQLEGQLTLLLKRLYQELKPYFISDDIEEEMEIFTTLPYYMTSGGKKYELSGHVIQLNFDQVSKENKSELEKKCADLKINLNYSSIFPFKFLFREQPKLKKIMLSTEKSGLIKVEDFFKTNLFGIANNITIDDSKGSQSTFYQIEFLNNIVHQGFQEEEDPKLSKRMGRKERKGSDSESNEEDEQEDELEEVLSSESGDISNQQIEEEMEEKKDQTEENQEEENQENNNNGQNKGEFLVEQIRKRAIQMLVLNGVLDHLNKLEISKIGKISQLKKIGLKEFNQLQDKKTNIDEEEGEYKETLEDTNTQNNQLFDRQIYKFQIDNIQVPGLKQTGTLQLYHEYPTKQYGKNYKQWLSTQQMSDIEKEVNKKKYEGDDLGLYYQFQELIKFLGDPSLLVKNQEMEQEKQQLEKEKEEQQKVQNKNQLPKQKQDEKIEVEQQ